MGQRSSSETITAILFAFFERNTWTHNELAKQVDVTPRTLMKHLNELRVQWKLEKQDEHPHVYWSVPKNWFPGGVIYSSAEIVDLLRIVTQAPQSRERKQAIGKIMKALELEALPRLAPAAVIVEQATEDEQRHRHVVEASIAQRVSLNLKYFSMNRGAIDSRHLSAYLITVPPKARIVAFCHRDRQLKWFRMNRIHEARLDPSEPYETVEQGAIDAYLRESVGGYHHGGPPVRCSFFVLEPDSRWVSENLPPPLEAKVVSGGIRVSGETAGLIQIARYVVGLGAAAKPETPELARLVKELAEGALRGAIDAGMDTGASQ